LNAIYGLPFAMLVLNELLNERLKPGFNAVLIVALAGSSFTVLIGGALLFFNSYFIFKISSSAINSNCSCAFVLVEHE
jgi:hypothetical protein